MENSTFPNTSSFFNATDLADTTRVITEEHEWYYIGIRSTQTALTVFGNLLVVIAVVRFENLRSPTNYLITGLASADMLASFSPFFLVAQKMTVNTQLWVGMCLAGESINSVATLTNILYIFIIGVDRYIYILHPFKYERLVNGKTTAIAAACVWLNCIVVSCVLVPVFSSLKMGMACRIVFIAQKVKMVYYIQMIFCVVAVIGIYLRIAVEAWRHSRRILQQGMPNNDSVTYGLKIAKMTAWVLGGYLLSVTPVLILQGSMDQIGNTYHVLERVSVIFWWNNCWINPVIYAWKDKDFRRSFRKLLRISQVHPELEMNANPVT